MALAGGGWYGANKLSDGALNEKAGAFISDTASEFGEKAVDTALEKAGAGENSAFGDFFKDHWGKVLLTGGGLLAAMKLPKPLRGLAIAAALVISLITVAQHYSSEKLQSDFEVAQSGEGAAPQRHIVMRDGFDPSDSNIVGQTRFGPRTNDRSGPEPEAEPV